MLRVAIRDLLPYPGEQASASAIGVHQGADKADQMLVLCVHHQPRRDPTFDQGGQGDPAVS